jgi:hypothetical protein
LGELATLCDEPFVVDLDTERGEGIASDDRDMSTGIGEYFGNPLAGAPGVRRDVLEVVCLSSVD